MKLRTLFVDLSYRLNESHLLNEAKDFSDKRDYDLMMHVFKDRVFPVLSTAGIPPTPEQLAALTDFPITKVKAWLDSNSKKNELHRTTGTDDHNMSVTFRNFRGSRDMHMRDAAKLATYVVTQAKSGKKLGLPKKQDILAHLGWDESYLQDVLQHTGDAVNRQVEKLVGKPVDVVKHSLMDNSATVNANKLAAFSGMSVADRKRVVRGIMQSLVKADPRLAGQLTADDIAREIYKPAKAYDTKFESLARAINKLLDSRTDAKGKHVNQDMFDVQSLLRVERQTRAS